MQRVPPRAGRRRVRAPVEQSARQLPVGVGGRDHQRGLAVGQRVVDVRPGVEQRARCFDRTRPDREQQRREPRGLRRAEVAAAGPRLPRGPHVQVGSSLGRGHVVVLDAAPERIRHQLLGHGGDEPLGAPGQRRPQPRRALERRAVGQRPRRVDGIVRLVDRPPPVDRIEVLERKPRGVDHGVARGARGVVPVRAHPLAHGRGPQVAQRALDAPREVLAAGPRLVVEPPQQRDDVGGGGTAIGAPRQPGQDLGGARRFVAGGLGRADEDAPAAGSVARPAIRLTRRAAAR